MSPINLRCVAIFQFPEACHRIFQLKPNEFEYSIVFIETHTHMSSRTAGRYLQHPFGICRRRRINEWAIESANALHARIKSIDENMLICARCEVWISTKHWKWTHLVSSRYYVVIASAAAGGSRSAHVCRSMLICSTTHDRAISYTKYVWMELFIFLILPILVNVKCSSCKWDIANFELTWPFFSFSLPSMTLIGLSNQSNADTDFQDHSIARKFG